VSGSGGELRGELDNAEMRLTLDSIWAEMTIWAEARAEPQEGKLAVAEVIRRRMDLKYFSHGTAASTVLWPWQFSCWNAGDSNRLLMPSLDTDDPIVLDCVTAWNATGQPGYVSVVPDAVLYCNLKIVKPAWAVGEKFVKTVGAHSFYRG
jgi:N-acetylmuramoyl-L-alanine amidase